MAQIHPSSLVDPQAKLAENVVVGPFCTIGPHVEVGEGTTLQSHIVLTGHTKMGKNNKIYAFAAIGIDPQDKKYRGEETQLIIGDNNVIREHCTLSVGTVQDKGVTIVGNGNLLMANVHVAHDCVIGNDTIIANNVGFAGHVHVADDVIVGGQSGIHQFVKIGKGAMLSGGSMVRQDCIPYGMYQGYPASPFGINLEGMKRHGYSRAAMHAARESYKLIFREGKTVPEAVEAIKAYASTLADEQAKKVCELMCEFTEQATRGLAR